LLSHHPPCDLDHTVGTAQVRICARCLGIAVGVILAFFWHNRLFDAVSWSLVLPPFLLPFPAAYDFVRHEVLLTPSNNITRIVTGCLLGFGLGLAVANTLYYHSLLGIIQIVWLLAIEFAIAYLMRRTGRADVFIRRYEESVRYVRHE